MWKRIGKLLVGAATMVVSAGWYIALVSLWPADSRPYIGGSTDNSLLQLALGYNGIERIAGGEGGPGGGPGGGGPGGANLFFGGEAGHRPTLRTVDGCRGVLAAARRAHRTCGGHLVHPAHRAHRKRPCRTAALGRLAAGDRRGVQLHGRHGAPVLHGGVGTGGRGAGRHFGGRVVARPGIPACRGSCWPPCRRPPASGRSSCWIARRIGCPPLRWIVLAGSVVVAAILAVGVHRLGRVGSRTGHRRSAFRPSRAYRVFDLQRGAFAQRAGHDVRAKP